MATTKALLNQQILRNLGDRSYDKRKQAALEIEQIVRQASQQNQGSQHITSIINVLVHDYTFSTIPNHRKGGLIGLSAIAIALVHQSHAYLELLLPPVLKCFTDTEARVRYYACEALYNITKVSRGRVLLYFNEVFDGLCKLFADADVDVKSGAQLLDKLVKDVVTESPDFSLENFIPLLRERIRIRNPFVRQLIVSWVTLLDAVPDIDLLEFLPEFLGGLFAMLADPNKDIRQQAYAALSGLLKQLSQAHAVDLAAMAPTLVEHGSSADSFTRLTVLTWLTEFARMGPLQLLHLLPALLRAVLPCLSDTEREIRAKASKCHDLLLRAAEDTPQALDVEPLLLLLSQQLLAQSVPVRLSSLRWIAMLLARIPAAILQHLDHLFPALLRALHDADDAVVRLDLEVIARLALDPSGAIDAAQFEMVIVNILTLFAANVKFLEARGSLVLRQLCVFLDAEAAYRVMARLLQGNVDTDFTVVMVQTLNLILLTASELVPLRAALKDSAASAQGKELFHAIFSAWVAAPVAALTLCLLAQQYELAWRVACSVPHLEVTVGLLLQLDKLVQLVESPVLVHVRLHMLEPHKYPHLLRALYALLALLPQSTAFAALNTRLASCVALTQVVKPVAEEAVVAGGLNVDALFEVYTQAQEAIAAKRKKLAKVALLVQQ